MGLLELYLKPSERGDMNTKIIRNEEEQKRADEIHDKFRDDLLKRQLSNTENYDKTILTLSSSGLAISLTFLNFIIPRGSANFIWIIQASWVCFLLSIVFSLIAYHVSNKAIDSYLVIAEDYYTHGDGTAFNRRVLPSIINTWINHIVGILFCVAITGVVAFVIVNLSSKEIDMTSKKVETSHSVMVGDSAQIPRMQYAPGNELSINSAQMPRMQAAPGSVAQTPVASQPSSNPTPNKTK